eukprot:m.76873 g.76873  ORF g.76873 m.76873 type:complete len:900 (-) comp14045_c0_seq1:63-2762(-)
MPIHGSMAFVSVDPKKSQPVSFIEPLAKFVAREYQQDPVNIKDAVKALNDLRNACIVKAPEKHDSGLNAVIKYYGTLTCLTRRFPFKTSEPWDGVLPSPICVKFSWEDGQASSMFGGKKTITLEDINFEFINVLFNIGAVHSQIGAMANLSSDSGLRHASVNFQSAATIFNTVAAQIHKYYTKPPSNDLQPMFLHALSFLMLAQSQEMYWRKCVVERKSNGIIAKLAKQTSSFYADAYRNLVASNGADKTWIAIAQAKTAFYEADAHYRVAMAEKEEEEIGSALARLRVAELKLAEAAHLAAGTEFSVTHLQNTIAQMLKEYERENSMIYMKVVPSAAALTPLAQHATVSADRPLPDYTSKEYIGEDPFAALIPVSVHQAAQRYEERRNQYVRDVVEQLKTATMQCVEGLTAMQLPGALQVAQSPTDMPQTLIDHCNEIRAAGGVEHLRQQINDLPDKSKTCREMLDETRAKLDQEEQDDMELRQQHGSRWTREPSQKLNTNMRKEMDKHTTIVDRAAESDMKVVERFHELEPAIVFMMRPIEEIKASLPAANASDGPAGPVEELTQLLQSLDELRAKRDAIPDKLEELKASDNIIPLLLEKAGHSDETSLFDDQLKHYINVVDEANQLIQETADVMAKTKDANDRFQASKSAGGGEREVMLNDLAAKYEAWKILNRDIEEGSKFYEQLAGLLSKQQAKCADFCVARDLEKKDLLSSITRGIASMPSEDYQAPVSQQPPARPPPPTTYPPSSSASQDSSYSAPPAQYPAVPQASTTSVSQPPHGQAQPQTSYMQQVPQFGYASYQQPGYSAPYGQSYQQPPQHMSYGQPQYSQPPPQAPYGQPPQMPYGQPPQSQYGQPSQGPYVPPYQQPYQQQPPFGQGPYASQPDQYGGYPRNPYQ